MTTLKTLAGACALALLAALPARAQTTPPPYGPPIAIENARKVMTAAEAEASKNNWAVVISIIDSGGNIVMLHRRDDVQLSSIEIAQGKAKTALMFKRPSKVLDDAIAGGGAGLRFLALKDIVPLEGGVPIVLDGKIIGAIGVSGVLSSQDAQIARAGIDALWVADDPTAAGERPRLEAWTALVLAGLDTSRARLGAMLNPPLRPPATLAAMARTLDLALGGRLEIGVRSAGEGVEEYARTLREILVDGPPLSVEITAPPEIGVAARVADDVVIPATALQDVRALCEQIRAGCEAAGRDPAGLGIAVEVPVSIGRTSAEAHARASDEPRFREIGHPAKFGIFGTLEQCQARAIELAHLGVTDLRCILPNTPDVHDAIAQLTAIVVGTIGVLAPHSPRSKAPDPPPGWGGRHG